jgi:sigma-E factor negative regulatory protein RseA
VGQSLRDDPSVEKYQTLAEFKAQKQHLPTTVAKVEKAKQNKHQPLNAQFNDYLKAHNSSVYTNGEANFQPYAAVTSFGQR